MKTPHLTPAGYTLRFLFQGVRRPWKALKGYDQPPSGVWEVRSLPSGLTAWGPSFQEAIARLQRTVDAAVAHAEDNGRSAVEWYTSTYGEMTEAEERAFEKGWGVIASKALPTYKVERPEVGKYEYAVLEPELEECLQ